MLVRVIYRDGKAGFIKASTIIELKEEGKIVAYKFTDRWVEARRKQQSKPDYQGPERRKQTHCKCPNDMNETPNFNL